MEAKSAQLTRDVIRIAWPAVCESLFITLAGFVDTLMVSTMGAVEVAAVGLTGQPKLMGLTLFFAMNIAISSIVARRYGEGRREDANGILPSALFFALLAALLISFCTVTWANEILRFCGSNDDTHFYAVQYYRIIMACIGFNGLMICINAAQRGIGNTKIALRTNVVANVVNVFGNYCLIGGHFGFPALGVRGAAYATVFGAFLGFLMSVFSLFRKDNYINVFYIAENRILPSVRVFAGILRVGSAVFIEQILLRIGFMTTAIFAASLGTGALAAHQVGMNILAMIFAFGDGLQVAIVALVGKTLGEQLFDKAKRYCVICQRIGFIVSVLIIILLLVLARPVYGLFFQEKAIIEYGLQITRVTLLITFFQIMQVIDVGCLRGAGDMRFTAILSGFSVTAVRTGGSYLFGFLLHYGIPGVWVGILADQVFRYIFAHARVKKGDWVNIRI